MKDNSILLGSDHLGLSLKNALKEHLVKKGYTIEDIGVDSEDILEINNMTLEKAKKDKK